mmetsp:Transcript_75852/g.219064  ORF Transcript_75852/g.219064 Transcript_75852/m.219064 type:complete len:219 (+) Transcript_75852:97-753(+)
MRARSCAERWRNGAGALAHPRRLRAMMDAGKSRTLAARGLVQGKGHGHKHTRVPGHGGMHRGDYPRLPEGAQLLSVPELPEVCTPDLRCWCRFTELVDAVHDNVRSRKTMLTERRQRHVLRKERNDSSVSSVQPRMSTVCTSCNSSAKASRERSDKAEAPPREKEWTERRASAAGHLGCNRRRTRFEETGAAAGASAPVGRNCAPKPKFRSDKSAWSS